jgi:hypothetical protein
MIWRRERFSETWQHPLIFCHPERSEGPLLPAQTPGTEFCRGGIFASLPMTITDLSRPAMQLSVDQQRC